MSTPTRTLADLGDGLLDTIDAREFLGISKSTLFKLVREGRIPVVRIDGCTRFLRSDLVAFVASHRSGGGPS